MGKQTQCHFIRKKYWYAVPFLVLVSKVYNFIRRKQ